VSKEIRCFNRLLVIGPGDVLARFVDSSWENRLQARYSEWLEHSRTRAACQFETTGKPPLIELTSLSSRWPNLVFLLDWEVEQERRKGLAKAKGGQLEQWSTHF